MHHSYFGAAFITLNAVVCTDSLTKTEADSMFDSLRLLLSQVTIPHSNYAKLVNTTSRIMVIRKICRSSHWNNKRLSAPK